MLTWSCSDGGEAVEIEAPTPEEAAQVYVDTGDWAPVASTSWIHVHVAPVDDPDAGERIRVRVDPEEPSCHGDPYQPHDWLSPHAVVGGIRDNPGVYGHAGGVIITEVCRRCGEYRVTDTWATDPETGEQGLRSLSYREPDEVSLRWAAKRKE